MSHLQRNPVSPLLHSCTGQRLGDPGEPTGADADRQRSQAVLPVRDSAGTEGGVRVRVSSTSTGTKIGPLMLTDPTPVVAAYSMRFDDELVLADATAGAFTVTLPDVTLDARPFYVIKKVDAVATVTVDGNGSQTIDGALTVDLASQWDSLLLVHDNAAWYKA